MTSFDKGKQPEREGVYNFALRVSYLSYLTRPKIATSFTPGHKSTPSKHLATSITNISISDVLKDSLGRDAKGVKFPEKFVKALEKKCEQVAMGRDPQWVVLEHFDHTLTLYLVDTLIEILELSLAFTMVNLISTSPHTNQIARSRRSSCILYQKQPSI